MSMPDTGCYDHEVLGTLCQAWMEAVACTTHRAWMARNYQKSCRLCGGGDESCVNDWACENWAWQDQCQTEWMRENCRRSCDICTDPQRGGAPDDPDHAACDADAWATEGRCISHTEWMVMTCRSSCNFCKYEIGFSPEDGCINRDHRNNSCQNRAFAGTCESEAEWMAENCPNVCGSCVKYSKADLLGCVDAYDKKSCEVYTARGECMVYPCWMELNCAQTCGICSWLVTPQPQLQEPPGSTCMNHHGNDSACELYHAQGECVTFPAWMLRFCARSCGQCSVPCSPTDIFCNAASAPSADVTDYCLNLHGNDDKCKVWAEQGLCRSRRELMKVNCARACGLCGYDRLRIPSDACSDAVRDTLMCKFLKAEGLCGSNPTWMNKLCKQTCEFCRQVTVLENNQCENLYKNDGVCGAYAQQGECTKSPGWMGTFCEKSCGVCVSATACRNRYNNDTACNRWMMVGECHKSWTWMSLKCEKLGVYCKESNVDNTCSNMYDDDKCDSYAANGDCVSNQNWMRRYCAESCGMCQADRKMLSLNGSYRN